MSQRPTKNRPPDDRHPRRPTGTVVADAPPQGQVGSPRAGLTQHLYVVSIICALLLLAVALVFGQTLSHQFVNYDDGQYVYENPPVVAGLTGQSVTWAFTSGHASNWHPLTWLSHMLDCQLYGLSPWGHHLSNVLLHAATAVILFLVLRQMTGDLWPSAFVAAVFAIHPLRVESVAWVAERKDVLSGLFFVLILAAYVSYSRHPFSLLRYLGVIALFALGLMSKPVLVTVPFVLLLLDYWPLGRMTPATGDPTQPAGSPALRLIGEKLPLFAIAAVSCAVTSLVQSHAMAKLEVIPVSWRIANAVVAYVVYLRQFVWPTDLAVFYPHPERMLPIEQVIGAALLLAGISVACLVARRRFPYLAVGWFWYVGMLVPMIGLVQVGIHSMADRYTYLPQIGLCIAVAWGVAQAVAARPQWRPTCGVVASLVLLILMGCAWQQTSFWRDSDTLWQRALACTTGNAMAHYNLGKDLSDRQQFDKAIVQYEAALKIRPKFDSAHNNLGLALDHRGQHNEAISHYRQALEVSPNNVDIYGNIGVALAAVGKTDEAIDHYQQAIRIKSDSTAIHNNYGMVLADQGKFDQAVAHYRQAIEADAKNQQAHYNLGIALAKQGKIDEAIGEYKRAIDCKPTYADPYNNLGGIYARRNQFDEAIAYFRQAVSVDPNYGAAYFNLGSILLDQGKPAQAVAQWREAVRCRPEDVMILNQLAWILATNPDRAVRNGAEAVDLARRAAKISGSREPAVLGTLAAAYAESGRFDEAVTTAQKALDLATQNNNLSLAESVRTKMKLYKAGTPFRLAPASPNANPSAP